MKKITPVEQNSIKEAMITSVKQIHEELKNPVPNFNLVIKNSKFLIKFSKLVQKYSEKYIK